MMFSPAVVVTAATACLVSAAPSHPIEQRSTPLAQVISSCVKNNTVALTFDDGPYIYEHDISKTLLAAGVKGTFFVNGNNSACIYEDNGKRLKYLYEKGHQIGQFRVLLWTLGFTRYSPFHFTSSDHYGEQPDLTSLTWDQMHDELWRVENAITRITGAYPAFLRPPYGTYNDLVRQAAYIHGQSLVIWDFDSRDAVGATYQQSEGNYTALVATKPKNILALNHETIETTAHEVVPFVIKLLQSNGYKLVTLAECLGAKPYKYVQAPAIPDVRLT
ncbi:Carbohydrate esterase 4 protein [Tulasnella sp. 427]|nr:Carbohydrate esterase 4 protein [Tulasnella sp. 427]